MRTLVEDAIMDGAVPGKEALMRIAAVVLCCWFAVACGCSSPPKESAAKTAAAAEEDDADDDGGASRELDIREIIGQASIRLSDAITAALAAKPGVAVEAELEGEIDDGRREVVFEVVIFDEAGVPFDVSVDPVTGAVREVEQEDDAKELGELAEIRATIPDGAMPLADLVLLAAKSAEGTPFEIEYPGRSAPAAVTVKLLLDKEERSVTLDAKSGTVVQKK